MAVMIEARAFRPFKSSEEYLYAMKEDLAEWLNTLYPELMINVDNFMDRLDSGVALCKHANKVRESSIEYEMKRSARGLAAKSSPLPSVFFFASAKPGTFFARDNVSNFIGWCRNALNIFECLLFETDDLILRKNEKHVILCLLEVARKGSKFGMLAPMLIQMEKQIDREILADARRAGHGVLDSEEDEDDTSAHDAPPLVYGPMPQIITNDLKSLDEMVRELVERCNCPTQFPMIRVSEGKYRIGDTKVLIFVRILRNHVMVRVGGGWDTLSHYLDKHDPCRCKAQHRTTHAARVVQRYPPAAGCMELNGAEVHYDRSPPRTRRSSVSSVGSSGGGSPQHAATQLGPPQHTAARQRSRSPANRGPSSLPYAGQVNNAFENQAFNHLTADNAYYQSKLTRRSVSPSPARKNTPVNRAPSPKPPRKKSTNIPAYQSTNPALVPSETLVPCPQKNYRSQSPSPKQPTINNAEIKTISNEKEIHQSYENLNHLNSIEVVTNIDNASNGSENASDNGSEVSDEGYRSLGIIQNTSGSAQASPPGSKDSDAGTSVNRLSMASQNSTEDAELSERSQNISINEAPYKVQFASLDYNSDLYSNETAVRSNSVAALDNYTKKYAIPHEEVSSVTGLRKTNYSNTLYGDKKPGDKTKNVSACDSIDQTNKGLQKSATSSKIPQTPALTRRRMSVENLSPQDRSRSTSYDRTIQREGSMVRDSPSPTKRPLKPSSKPPTVPANSPTGGNNSFTKMASNAPAGNNTWNGRTQGAKGKSRPAITNDTFTPNRTKVLSPQFQRNSNLRASTTGLRNMSGYDHNGRKIKTSPNSSPSKSKQSRSPLVEQILKTTNKTKDETALIESLRNILKQYDPKKEANDWTHTNGSVEQSQSSRQSEETESSSGLKSTALVTKIPALNTRKTSVSRIPAPLSYKKGMECD